GLLRSSKHKDCRPAKRHSGWYGEAGCNGGDGRAATHSDHPARARRRKSWRCTQFEKVSVAPFDHYCDNGCKARRNFCYTANRADVVPRRATRSDRECTQVSNHKSSAGACDGSGHDVALSLRNVKQASDDAAGRHRIDLAMIRFNCVKHAVSGNHAIPGAVWLEVSWLNGFGRMKFDKRAKVSDA